MGLRCILKENVKIIAANIGRSLFLFSWSLFFGLNQGRVQDKCFFEGDELYDWIIWDSVAGGIFFIVCNLPCQLYWHRKLERQQNANNADQTQRINLKLGKYFNRCRFTTQSLFITLVLINMLISIIGLRRKQSDFCSDFLHKKFSILIYLSTALLGVMFAVLILLKLKSFYTSQAAVPRTEERPEERDKKIPDLEQQESSKAVFPSNHDFSKKHNLEGDLPKIIISPKDDNNLGRTSIQEIEIQEMKHDNSKEYNDYGIEIPEGLLSNQSPEEDPECNPFDISIDISLMGGDEEEAANNESPSKTEGDPLAESKSQSEGGQNTPPCFENETDKQEFQEKINRKLENMVKTIFDNRSEGLNTWLTRINRDLPKKNLRKTGYVHKISSLTNVDSNTQTGNPNPDGSTPMTNPDKLPSSLVLESESLKSSIIKKRNSKNARKAEEKPKKRVTFATSAKS